MSKKSVSLLCSAVALAVVSVFCFVNESTVSGILFASAAGLFAISGLLLIKK